MNEHRQEFNIDPFNKERLSKAYKKKITNVKKWPLIGFFIRLFSKIADHYDSLDFVKSAFDKVFTEIKSLALNAIVLIAGAISSLKNLIYSLPISVLKFVEDLYLTIYGKVKNIGYLPAWLALVFRGINWINSVLRTALGGTAAYLGLMEFFSSLGLSVAVPSGLAVSFLPVGIVGIATFTVLVKTIKTVIEWARATDPKDQQNLKFKFFQNLTMLAVIVTISVLAIVFAANPIALLIVAASAVVVGGLLTYSMGKIFPKYKEIKIEDTCTEVTNSYNPIGSKLKVAQTEFPQESLISEPPFNQGEQVKNYDCSSKFPFGKPISSSISEDRHWTPTLGKFS